MQPPQQETPYAADTMPYRYNKVQRLLAVGFLCVTIALGGLASGHAWHVQHFSTNFIMHSSLADSLPSTIDGIGGPGH